MCVLRGKIRMAKGLSALFLVLLAGVLSLLQPTFVEAAGGAIGVTGAITPAASGKIEVTVGATTVNITGATALLSNGVSGFKLTVTPAASYAISGVTQKINAGTATAVPLTCPAGSGRRSPSTAFPSRSAKASCSARWRSCSTHRARRTSSRSATTHAC